jgi:hypothetical protein
MPPREKSEAARAAFPTVSSLLLCRHFRPRCRRVQQTSGRACMLREGALSYDDPIQVRPFVAYLQIGLVYTRSPPCGYAKPIPALHELWCKTLLPTRDRRVIKPESSIDVFYFAIPNTKRRFQKDVKGAVNFMDMLLTFVIVTTRSRDGQANH